MSGTLKTALRIKLQILAGLVIATALVVLLLRFSLWLLPHYQQSLKTWLSTETLQIDFATLEVEWESGLPQLSINALSLTTASGANHLAIERIEAKVDWWRTLLSTQPAFRHLDVQGLKGTVDLSSDELQALLNRSDDSDSTSSDWLFTVAKQRHIELRDSHIQLIDQQKNLHDLSLMGELQGHFDEFNGVVLVENALQQSVQLRLAVVPDNESSSGRLYLDIDEGALTYWQPMMSHLYPDLTQLEAGGELWLAWRDDQLTQAAADIQLSRLSLKVEDHPLTLDDFYFRFRAEQQEQQWRYLLQPSQGRINETPIPFDRLTGFWDEQQSVANINTLDLGILNRLLAQTPQLPEAITKELQVLAPTGLLRDLRVSVDLASLEPQGEETVVPRFLLNTTLAGVAVEAYDGAPRIDNIEGQLSHDEQGGIITFKSQPMFLHFPDLFANGWGINEASGTVLWQLSPDKVWVESDLLQINMDGILAKGRFSLDMPYAKGTESHLSLLIGTQGADGKLTPALLPGKELDPELYEWLGSAIEQGQVNTGLFLFEGPLESWAPDPSIQLYFDVTDTSLKYSPEWPAISAVKGEVLVKDSAVLVQAVKGRMFNSQLQHSDVYLADGSDFLQVTASMQGPAADTKNILLNSPVKESLGDEFERWSLAGSTQTALDLNLDLRNVGDSRYQVTSELKDGRYYSDYRELSIDKINGTFVYDHQKGLNAKSVKAEFFDRPIFVRIDTKTEKDTTHTVVRADGSLDIKRLNQWLDLEVLNLAKGETSYSAFVDICSSGAGDCSSLRVKSDLKGITTELVPEPFAKKPEELSPFELRTEMGGETNWMRLKMPGRMNALLLLKDDAFVAGDIVFGKTKQQPIQRQQGLWLNGELAKVVVADWQALFERYSDNSITEHGTVNAHPLLEAINLKVDELIVSDTVTLAQLQLGLTPADNGQWLSVSSPNLEGKVFLPTEPGLSYQADFERLYLPKAEVEDEVTDATTTDAAEDEDPLLDVDPKSIPGLELTVADLRYGERPMGRWHVNLQPQEDGIKLAALSGTNNAMSLKGDAEWIQQQGGHLTRVSLDFSAEELAKVQTLFDIEPVIESEKFALNADLFWMGSPLGYNSKSLGGDVKINAGKGRFMEVGSASALRVFGILNLNTIGRRLRLDFGDLSQKGLSFDKILGHYRINEGVAKSTEPLKFTGPSADIELTGLVNLNEETLNKQMRVTLPLSDSLPLTALLLGTPQVAGAMFLFDKITGSKLSEITSTLYSVKGPWDDPKIESIKSSAKQKAAN